MKYLNTFAYALLGNKIYVYIYISKHIFVFRCKRMQERSVQVSQPLPKYSW